MQEIKVNGVVINNIDYKDKDKLVVIYTLEKGLIMAKMRGVRQQNAKLKFAKEPCILAEFELLKSSENYTIKTVNLMDSFSSIVDDLDNFYASCMVLETIRIIGTNQPNPNLYLTLLQALKHLAYEETNAFLVTSKFFIDVLSITGFKINTNRCFNCNAQFNLHILMDYNLGALVCEACSSESCQEISHGTFNAIKILNSSAWDKISTIRLPDKILKELNMILIKNLESRFLTNFKTKQFFFEE